MPHRQPSLAIRLCFPALVYVSLLLAGCQQTELPSAPWLLTEDFGVGIHLGQATAAAEDAASKLNDITTWVLTADDFASRNPYNERSAERDLLVAKYFDLPGGVPEPGIAYEQVLELKLFLADPAYSQLTLKGERIAQLDPSELAAMLGKPVTTTDSPDGLKHMTFYFALEDDPRRALSVISTHDLVDMSLKDFALALVPNPEQ